MCCAPCCNSRAFHEDKTEVTDEMKCPPATVKETSFLPFRNRQTEILSGGSKFHELPYPVLFALTSSFSPCLFPLTSINHKSYFASLVVERASNSWKNDNNRGLIVRFTRDDLRLSSVIVNSWVKIVFLSQKLLSMKEVSCVGSDASLYFGLAQTHI